MKEDVKKYRLENFPYVMDGKLMITPKGFDMALEEFTKEWKLKYDLEKQHSDYLIGKIEDLKKFREKFGSVLPSDDAVEICQAVESWLNEIFDLS